MLRSRSKAGCIPRLFEYQEQKNAPAGVDRRNPVDNFRKVNRGNSPSYARGTAADRRRMPWQKWRSDRAKKEPRHFCRSSFAAPRTPLRVDAEAPGQAPHNHSSANVRHCQGLAPKKAQRQGQGREPPGLTLARSRYNGRAHGLTNPTPGELRSSGGRGPHAAGTALPGATQRGAAGRGGAGGEPHGEAAQRAQAHASTEGPGPGPKKGGAQRRQRPRAGGSRPRSREAGGPERKRRADALHQGEHEPKQGRPTREPAAQRGQAAGQTAAARARRARTRAGRAERWSRGRRGRGAGPATEGRADTPDRARAAAPGAPRRSGRAQQAKRSGAVGRGVRKKRARRAATQRGAGPREQARTHFECERSSRGCGSRGAAADKKGRLGEQTRADRPRRPPCWVLQPQPCHRDACASSRMKCIRFSYANAAAPST